MDTVMGKIQDIGEIYFLLENVDCTIKETCHGGLYKSMLVSFKIPVKMIRVSSGTVKGMLYNVSSFVVNENYLSKCDSEFQLITQTGTFTFVSDGFRLELDFHRKIKF